MSAIVGSKRDLKTAFSSTDANNLPHTSTSQQVQQAANLSFKDEARYKQVVREFRQIEHLDNTHAPKYAQCMLALNKLENFSELLNTFKRAKEKGKIDASVYAEYMDALIKSQQFKECLQIFEEAKQAGHLNEKVFGHYMLAANAIGQPQKAVDVLPEAESRAHINPYIYQQFVLAANKLNLLLQIVNVRKRAELNGFVNPPLYAYFIHAAIKLKMYPEVIDIFNAARKQGHLNPTIYAYTMKATYIYKQFQHTIDFFHLAVQNNHLNSFVCLYFMRAARELKNFEEIIDAFENADSRGYVHAEIYSIAITAANQLGQFEKVIAIFEKAQSTNENEFEADNCAQFLYAAAQLKKGADVRNVFEKIVTHRSADAELFFLALPFLSSAQSSHYVKRIESSTLGRIKLIAQLIKKNVSNEWVKEWAQKNENLLLPHPDAINDLVELSKKHEISSNDLNTWFKISREYQEGKIDFNPFFADSIPLIFFQNIFPLISANEIERLTPFSLEKGLKNLLRQNWTFTVCDSTDSNPPHLKIWFEKGLKKTGVETQTLLIKKALQYPDFIKSWHPQFLSDIFHDTITNPSQKDVWKKLLPILFIHLKQKNGTPIVEVLLKHLLIFDESIIRNIMNACKANSSPSTTTIYPTCSTLYKTCQSKLPPPPPPPPPPQSHYSVLELTKDAKADDIKKAYRKLALKLHPDKGGSEEKFKRLGEAFFVLSDPQKKQAYDLDLKSKPL